jgi:hypothetical protein
MKEYEFSLVHRHAANHDKNVKIKYQGDDAAKICEQAVIWLHQKLKPKIQYQWELPSAATVLSGMESTTASADHSGVISNKIDGILVKVRQVMKPVRAKASAAVPAAN